MRPALPAALLAAVLLGACAAAGPPGAPRRPAAGRFVAPPAGGGGEAGWIGAYAGAVDVYSAERDSWQRGSPIQLIIQSDGPDALRILGHVNLTAGRRSFYISGIEVPPRYLLAGEQDAGPDTGKYAYSLTLSGDVLTGFVKWYQRAASGAGFEPGDEWHFEVSRRALLPLR